MGTGGRASRIFFPSRLRSLAQISGQERKFVDGVKSVEPAAVLVLVY